MMIPQFLLQSFVGRLFVICLLGSVGLIGCRQSVPEPQEVVVYTALDQEFSKPIFDAFTRETGILVRAKFDTESTKTVGLAAAIQAESAQPRCDLFWNNEALHTLRLAQQGLLRSYSPPAAEDYPVTSKSPDHLWHGFAARARVLIVNTNLVKEARRPKSIQALVDPQWYDRVGIAKPLFGTTATHAACLYGAWGAEKTQHFFEGLKRNARILSGNRQVARAVASGTLMFGLTDTDDAMLELEAGQPVAIIYPDQSDDEIGTLFIPNTLALINRSPNPEPAEQLLQFLLSPKIEGRLVMGPSAQIPLNQKTAEKARVETPATVRAMSADFSQAAQDWPQVSEMLIKLFASAS